jgi:hypothetical protein
MTRHSGLGTARALPCDVNGQQERERDEEEFREAVRRALRESRRLVALRRRILGGDTRAHRVTEPPSRT